MTDAGSFRVEVRAANAEEMEAFGFVTHTTLASHGSGGFNDPMADLRPEWTLCVFEDGAMVTSFAAWPFSMRWNGARIHAAGVTSVGTLPHKRRRGYLTRAMTTAFGSYRDAGQPVAILHASQAAIYQRYGYAIVAPVQEYRVDPREIRFAARPPTAGQVRLTDKSERETLQSLYRTYAEPRTGLLHRGAALWDGGALDEHDAKAGPAYVAIYEEEGEAQGYAVYLTRPGDESGNPDRNHIVTVRELHALTPAAYVSLWEHVGGHDLASVLVRTGAPIDDPLFHMLEEPRRLGTTVRDNLMLRIVDVAPALSTRLYAVAGRVTFELIDERCEWNRGTWTLETQASANAGATEASGAQAALTRSSGEAEFRLDVRALSALASGARSATALYEQGALETSQGERLRSWDALFATMHRPHCADMF